jgi:hypothetical protein
MTDQMNGGMASPLQCLSLRSLWRIGASASNVRKRGTGSSRRRMKRRLIWYLLSPLFSLLVVVVPHSLPSLGQETAPPFSFQESGAEMRKTHTKIYTLQHNSCCSVRKIEATFKKQSVSLTRRQGIVRQSSLTFSLSQFRLLPPAAESGRTPFTSWTSTTTKTKKEERKRSLLLFV